jgi:hypothetical protein
VRWTSKSFLTANHADIAPRGFQKLDHFLGNAFGGSRILAGDENPARPNGHALKNEFVLHNPQNRFESKNPDFMAFPY